MSTFKHFEAPVMPDNELEHRIQRFREVMIASKVDALVITSRANFAYLTGYNSVSWHYTARPSFAILSLEDFIVVASPAEERSIAFSSRPFRSVYYNGFQAEAVEKIIEAIGQLNLGQNATVAIDYGQDIFGRGCLELIDGLRGHSTKMRVISGEKIVWSARKIKSEFEANLKKRSFAIMNASFDEAIANARVGITERELLRSVKCNLLQNGAESVDHILLTSGRGEFGYGREPGDRRLEAGDYVWSDFFSTYYGYPADRNRIARCGEPSLQEVKTYQDVRSVTIELCKSIRPGMKGSDVYRHFEKLWSDAGLDPIWAGAGRIGHDSGMEVTEPNGSIAPWSDQLIEAGMIIHLEPKLEKHGGVFQFEEVVYVRPDGVEFLSELSPEACPVIPAE